MRKAYMSLQDMSFIHLDSLWVELFYCFFIYHVFFYFTATTPSVMGIISKGTTNTKANSSELFQVRHIIPEHFLSGKISTMITLNEHQMNLTFPTISQASCWIFRMKCSRKSEIINKFNVFNPKESNILKCLNVVRVSLLI